MAETASILSPGEDRAAARPRRRLLAGRLDHRRAAARLEGQHPGAVVVMYVNTTAEVKAETDYCVTSSNAVAVVEHIYREHGAGHGDPLRPRHVPRRLRREARRAGRCTCGTASATSTPASARATSPRCAPRTRAPTSSSTRSAAARRRSWSTWPPATSTPRACTCSRPAGCSTTPRRAAAGHDGDHGHRGRHAAPAADGGARRRLHRRQRGGELPLHEDDHAAEAARRAARRASRW